MKNLIYGQNQGVHNFLTLGLILNEDNRMKNYEAFVFENEEISPNGQRFCYKIKKNIYKLVFAI